MRRDYIDVDVRSADDSKAERPPAIALTFDGPTGLLADRLATGDGRLDDEDVDVTYRRTEADEPGVLSLANRLTGEFVLEANVDAESVSALVDAAKGADADDDTCYEVRITDGEGDETVYEKRTLLVYDPDGSLRRQDSLIPGGVEL